MQNKGTTQLDEHTYEKAHDDLAKLFDWAIDNPLTLLDIGHGVYVTALNAILSLNHTTINIVDTAYPEGAGTQRSEDFTSATITLDPQNPGGGNFVNWINGFHDVGIDFTIFHEFGHAIYDVFEHALDTEAMADSAAFSMMNALGIPPPPANAVGGGFDD